MSRAGKKVHRSRPVTRESTNLKLDIELKKWAIEHVDEDQSPYGKSVSELVNQLIAEKKVAVEAEALKLGRKLGERDAAADNS